MDLQTYQKQTGQFAVYPKEQEREYLAAGLVSEVGEVFGVFARAYRGDGIDTKKLRDELGDCMWMLSQIANLTGQKLVLPKLTSPYRMSDESHLHWLVTGAVDIFEYLNNMTAFTLEDLSLDDVLNHLVSMAIRYELVFDDVLQANIAKLTDRRERGVIRGSGDER